MSASDGARCRSCGSGLLEVFHRQQGVPVHSCRLVRTRGEAQRFRTGTLTLAVCRACGFIGNTSFDSALQDYSIAYEETQAFSPRFQAFIRELAEDWIERYDLHDKEILELGSGKGEFLMLLCALGPNRGTGIDPGVVPERLAGPGSERVTTIRDYYTDRYADMSGDAVVCRHTLEHIDDVAGFLARIRRGIGDRRDVVLLFELPDVGRVLRETAFWDVYYEHVSYFSPGSLARLFRRSGFEVVGLSLAYDDQYILLEARPTSSAPGRSASSPLEEEPEEQIVAAARFHDSFEVVRTEWRTRLLALRERGDRAVLWGAGSKAVAFLAAVGADVGVEYAVDVNPFKHGTYIAGAGQAVVGPEFLREHQPQLVVAMNEIYRGEIAGALRELGVDAELATV